jgi:hypothetical protein
MTSLWTSSPTLNETSWSKPKSMREPPSNFSQKFLRPISSTFAAPRVVKSSIHRPCAPNHDQSFLVVCIKCLLPAQWAPINVRFSRAIMGSIYGTHSSGHMPDERLKSGYDFQYVLLAAGTPNPQLQYRCIALYAIAAKPFRTNFCSGQATAKMLLMTTTVGQSARKYSFMARMTNM